MVEDFTQPSANVVESGPGGLLNSGLMPMWWKWRLSLDHDNRADKAAGKAAGKARINRRDLLQGKFWKLIRPSRPTSLVMRYPRVPKVDSNDATSNDATSNEAHPRVNHGISIEPVAPTDVGAPAPARLIPVFRPPGAIEESQFLAGCTRCNDCAEACPYDAIRRAPERLVAIAGTPTIEADTSACMMCQEFPCIAACEPGVLVSSIPKVMGTAKITEHLCLAHHGTTCTVCSERCPVAGAIQVNRGKPTIDESTCVGCGVCRYVCPAPENAILLMPAFIRPARPVT